MILSQYYIYMNASNYSQEQKDEIKMELSLLIRLFYDIVSFAWAIQFQRVT
jgi:outer membrane phospholipase A